ncbi:MAG: EamA family transporter RarD [Planctomycetota bacterium]|jgi:chloramphenicol-sensitive protein RarD
MTPHSTPSDISRSQRIGVAEAMIAYLFWGFATGIYFKLLNHVDAFELLTWRVLAGLPVMLVLVSLPPGIGRIRAAITTPKAFRILFLSTLLISLNWFTFIYAVVSDRLVEASLGYYINPLVSVLLGRIVLGERLHPLQRKAIWIAVIGVVLFGWSAISTSSMAIDPDRAFSLSGLVELPWISLVLPVSFGCYGLLRKKMQADSVTGLTIEMLLLFPVMLALQLVLAARGVSSFTSTDWSTDVLLLVGGFVTVLPLIAFAAAARRLRLATIGILQYVAPTCQFILAVTIFGEAVSPMKLAAFGLIWIAVALYCVDAYRELRGAHSTTSTG